jgi:putative NADH-flavin reductase
MNQKPIIAVIGGTGKSGKYLVNELINQGFEIKVLVRNPQNFLINSPQVEMVEGNVSDYNSVLQLIENCQAVISTLGMGIPASEPTIFSESTIHVIRAMNACQISRYIVTTGLNVDTPFDSKKSKTAMATEWMKSNYPRSTADRQLEYEILRKSNLDWTLVRLPLIKLTDQRFLAEATLEDCEGDEISATDLANFLIEQLNSNSYIKQSPFVFNI